MNEYKNLESIVEETLASVSHHTQRAYGRYIPLFIEYMEKNVDWSRLQENVLASWKPFVTQTHAQEKAEWHYNTAVPAAILNEVTPALRDKFLNELKVSSSARAIARGAIHKLMFVAWQNGKIVLLDGDGKIEALGLKLKDKGPNSISLSTIRNLRLLLSGKKDFATLVAVDLVLCTAMRVSEIAKLKVGSFQIDKGRLWVTYDGLKIILTKPAQKNIEDYLEATGRTLTEEFSNTPLLVEADGTAVSKRKVRYMLRNLFDMEELKAYELEDLRRTCALNAIENGASISDVLTLLRIDRMDVQTLSNYLGLKIDGIPIILNLKYD